MRTGGFCSLKTIISHEFEMHGRAAKIADVNAFNSYAKSTGPHEDLNVRADIFDTGKCTQTNFRVKISCKEGEISVKPLIYYPQL